jgi:hypothetical protein
MRQVSSDASGLFGCGDFCACILPPSAAGCVIRLATPPRPFLVWNAAQLASSALRWFFDPTFLSKLSSFISSFEFILVSLRCLVCLQNSEQKLEKSSNGLLRP